MISRGTIGSDFPGRARARPLGPQIGSHSSGVGAEAGASANQGPQHRAVAASSGGILYTLSAYRFGRPKT